MNLIVNGRDTQVPERCDVVLLLQVEQVKYPDMVSVELNGEILERKDFPATVLREGDKVEFLYFMGGGSGLHG